MDLAGQTHCGPGGSQSPRDEAADHPGVPSYSSGKQLVCAVPHAKPGSWDRGQSWVRVQENVAFVTFFNTE